MQPALNPALLPELARGDRSRVTSGQGQRTTNLVTAAAVSARAMEAPLEEKSHPGRPAAAQTPGWVIWPGPGRGYLALEGDLPAIADTLEVIWWLRAQQPQIADDHSAADGRYLLLPRKSY